MRSTAIVGVALIVLGLVALAYQRINFTTRETVLDIGPARATAERHRTLPLPPVLGAVVVAGGLVLLVSFDASPPPVPRSLRWLERP